MFAVSYSLGVCTAIGRTYGMVGRVAVIWVYARYFGACRGLMPGSFMQYPAQEKW